MYEVLRPKRTSLAARVPQADEGFLEFVRSLLQYDPAARPSAEAALAHPWLAHEYEGPVLSPVPERLMETQETVEETAQEAGEETPEAVPVQPSSM